MGLKRGTLVRPYDSYVAAHTCKNGVCVGRIVVLDIEDEPLILVKWLERCNKHQSGERYEDRNVDDLWEIGQIY